MSKKLFFITLSVFDKTVTKFRRKQTLLNKARLKKSDFEKTSFKREMMKKSFSLLAYQTVMI